VASPKILLRYLFGGTEESQVNRSVGRNSNGVLPKYSRGVESLHCDLMAHLNP
jgi:hypothetical protein